MVYLARLIQQKSDKRKWVCYSCRLDFHEAGLWSFGNSFARNVVIFRVENSSSFLSDKHKNNFLI